MSCASAISVYSLASSLGTVTQPTADDLKGTGDYILGRADTAPENADMDGDGVIDAFDMVLMRQALSTEVEDDTEIQFEGRLIGGCMDILQMYGSVW